MDLQARRQLFQVHLTAHFPKVYNYVLRLVRRPATAEDLTQDAFLKAWQAFDQYDAQKPFQPWIFQIARRTALDYFRKHREFANPDVLAEQSTKTPSPEQNALNQEKTQRLESALQQLPEAQRTAVFLYYVEHLDMSELAQVMKSTKSGVISLLHRARQRMKKNLETN
jgi:RNA polymerase sigma-70 factor (ECF subfamily)